MAFLFKDLYKPVKNILNTGYGSEGVEFNINSVTLNGTRIESTGNRHANGQLTGDLQWKQSFVKNANAFNVTGKLDNDGTVKATVDVTGLAKGLTLTTGGAMHTIDGDKNGDSVRLAAEYLHDKVATAAEVSCSRTSKPVVANVSALATHEGLSLGAAAALNLKSESKVDVLSNYDLGVRYSRENLDIAMQLEDKLSNIKVGVATNQISKDVSVAVQFSQKLKYAPEEKKSPAVWTMGFSKRIDADSSLKGKVNTNGIASTVYSLRLSEYLQTNLTLETNIKDSSRGSKLGVAFDYSPSF